MLAVAAAAELLGGYSEPDETLTLVGRAGFFASLVAVGVLERVQFRLRFLEAKTWWASNGRDILNAVAFVLLAGALGLIGFGGPLAIVIAATVLVLMIALQSAFSVRRHATALSIALAVILGTPVVIAPRAVDGFFKALLMWLFR